MLSSIQTLGRISWIAWVGLTCILTSSRLPSLDFFELRKKQQQQQPLTTTLVLAVTIAVGIQDRPAAAPQTGHWESDYQLFKNPSFTEAITAVSSLVFAYAGTPAFFSIVAEMRDPRLYNRSLAACQTGVTAFYITIGVVVYYFCGSYVASPALGSAGLLMKKVCYGLALPGLLATTTIVIHVSPDRLIGISFPHPSKSLLTRETKKSCRPSTSSSASSAAPTTSRQTPLSTGPPGWAAPSA